MKKITEKTLKDIQEAAGSFKLIFEEFEEGLFRCKVWLEKSNEKKILTNANSPTPRIFKSPGVLKYAKKMKQKECLIKLMGEKNG